MAQLETSTPGTFITQHGGTRFGRNMLISIATLFLIGAVAATGVIVFQTASFPAVDARPLAGEPVDGWMPGLTEANRAASLDQARRTQDGWSSAVLKPETQAVDGWASRYLVDDD